MTITLQQWNQAQLNQRLKISLPELPIFSTYVAVGNSLTAGYSDGALFLDGQTASYPNMLASSFAQVDGGEFTQPLVPDNLGGLLLGGQPLAGFENRFILSFASGSPAPTRLEGSGSTEVTTLLSGPFNNMGVPGAKNVSPCRAGLW